MKRSKFWKIFSCLVIALGLVFSVDETISQTASANSNVRTSKAAKSHATEHGKQTKAKKSKKTSKKKTSKKSKKTSKKAKKSSKSKKTNKPKKSKSQSKKPAKKKPASQTSKPQESKPAPTVSSQPVQQPVSPVILNAGGLISVTNGSQSVSTNTNTSSSSSQATTNSNSDSTSTPVDPAKDSVKVDVYGPISKGNKLLTSGYVKANKGDTAFTVSQRLFNQNGVKIDYTGSGSTVYVSMIAGYREMQLGSMSGWLYRVNGTFPDVSCGTYSVKTGDTVEWMYTENMGQDRNAPMG
ncbi:DUF4430 domain-containing protein [Lentilactobacillus sp. Marseille-Q4993]|uniref:DUF4430 domain-containing protein n=1 Tax=Lentilactobacillus sp. Marseille-Q4993 TaxID=3039492 RepID=UPI0024BD347C|nr:DUF4430 domain-containing protein [Lentilactobacillus sp. Marseille-Q4993]